MEFLLSFPSFVYMRLDKSNCSVLNPKAAGAVSIVESLIDDYISIFTSADTVALNMSLFSLCCDKVSEKELCVFLSKIHSVLKGKINRYIIFCTKKDTVILDRMLREAGFRNYDLVISSEFVSGRYEFVFAERDSNIEILQPGLDFYLSESDRKVYQEYCSEIESVWKIIHFLKKELFRYQIFEFIVREKKYNLKLVLSELEIKYNIIVSKSDYLGKNLEGKVKTDSIGRFFQIENRVIENEIYFLKTGLDNYFIELDNYL